MSTTPHVQVGAEKRSVEMEYTTLRTEIIERIKLRQQIVSVTLTVAGVFLGVGLTRDLVVLIYPPLAAFLALWWAQNDFRIKYSAKYIRKEIEPLIPGLRYETYMQQEREAKSGGLGSWSSLVLSHGGIFLFTQLMAIGIEISKPEFNRLKWTLLGVDSIALLLVIWLLIRVR